MVKPKDKNYTQIYNLSNDWLIRLIVSYTFQWVQINTQWLFHRQFNG